MKLAPPGVNGPLIFGVLAPVDDLDDLVVDATTGTITGRWDAADDPFTPAPLANHIDDLLNGQTYLQVHTVDFPPPLAEIRGQVTAVPEPAAWNEWGIVGAVVTLGVFGARDGRSSAS